MAVLLSGSATAFTTGLAVSGRFLQLAGSRIELNGINVPQAATFYPVNGGCGAQIEPAALFSALPDRTAFRVSFAQEFAISRQTRGRDWRGLDRVIRAAETSKTRPMLIVGLGSQNGVCDGGVFKDLGWYQHGYREPLDHLDDGLPRIAYFDYLREVLDRYGSHPSIVLWEPMGEPEAPVCQPGLRGTQCAGAALVCTHDATDAIIGFFEAVNEQIRRRDPGALIGTAAIGGDQCGWAGDGALRIANSDAIDVLSVHDYTDAPALAAAFRQRFQEARTVRKPIIVGEVGVLAGSGPRCRTPRSRSMMIAAKKAEARAAGADGMMLWALGDLEPACNLNVAINDPSLAIVLG